MTLSIPIPDFTHHDIAVENNIKMILQTPLLKNREQILILCGIYLNNLDLIKYAATVDPTVVNAVIKPCVLSIVKKIFPSF